MGDRDKETIKEAIQATSDWLDVSKDATLEEIEEKLQSMLCQVTKKYF